MDLVSTPLPGVGASVRLRFFLVLLPADLLDVIRQRGTDVICQCPLVASFPTHVFRREFAS